MTKEVFDKIDAKIKKITLSDTGGVVKSDALNYEEQEYLGLAVLQFIENSLPVGKDQGFDVFQILNKMSKFIGSKHPDFDVKEYYLKRKEEMRKGLHNNHQIIIRTKCGEVRAFTMSQEINAIEFMGRKGDQATILSFNFSTNFLSSIQMKKGETLIPYLPARMVFT